MTATSLDGILVSVGNPLLDISANVKEELITKYQLKKGNACLAEPQHLPLYDELVQSYKVEYIAGGDAQNSTRAAQWMIQVPNVCHYIGCVGNDQNGKTLAAAAAKDGVTTHYLIDPQAPTGTCAVLVHDKERSLVANLGAAEKYKGTHFTSPEIEKLLAKAKFYYTTGFFLTHSPDTLVSLGQLAAKTNNTLLMNLSAPFIIEFFWERLAAVLPYADVVFCNEDEAAALGKKQNWGTDLEEIAKKLVNFPKENKSRGRIVIFTQGSKQTIVCVGDKVSRFAPVPVKKEDIVDTNGAGDSFVGGFLSRFVQGKSIEECVAAGHYCAKEVIMRSGCTFPPKPTFTYP